MIKKLAKKSVAYIAAMAMVLSGISFQPVRTDAKTYQDNESIKPDDGSRTVYHDLDKLTTKTWTFDSNDATKASKISWDSTKDVAVLTIQNIDLSVTNTEVDSYISYFSYTGNVKPLKIVLKGTNSLELNGNVCFIQSTGEAPVTIVNESNNAAGMYVTMNPVVDSSNMTECHFMEVYGNCNMKGGNDSDKTLTLSVETTGNAVVAYTNIYVGGNLKIENANICSTIAASSSYMSTNAIVVNGNLDIDADSRLVAKCNVADTNVPYRTVNNSLLVAGTYKDAGASIYLTNVNGRPLSTDLSLADVTVMPKAVPDVEVDDKGSVTSVKARFGTYGSVRNDIMTIKDRLTDPVDNYWFYSEASYVTDANNFLATQVNQNTNEVALSYAQDENKEYYFTHPNVSPFTIPVSAKTLMSGKTMALTAKASDATAGVSYENNDVIVSIKGDFTDAQENNMLIIDGKIINIKEWGDAITLDNKYVAVKLEGGTVTMREPGVYYYVFSEDFCKYLGNGTHQLEIHTTNGIIQTQLTVNVNDMNAGDSVGSADDYGRIIAITKNESGDMIYTYDNGTVRVVSFDKDGNQSSTKITWSNGDTLVKNPDGTSSLTQTNGSVTIYDKDGNVVSIHNPGGDSDGPAPSASPKPDGGDGEDNVSSSAKALDLVIGGISNGYTHAPVSDNVLNSAKSEMESVTPDGKTASLVALSDIKIDGASADDDGKYLVKLDIAAISASDSIMIMHRDSGGWDIRTPDVVGNGYITAGFDSLSPVAIVRLADIPNEGEDNPPIEPSDESKDYNNAISGITTGFANNAVTDGSIITAAQTAMNDVKGDSDDIYTLRAVSEISKLSGTDDGTVEFKVKGITNGDEIIVLARQDDSSWDEIEASVNNGKVAIDSGDLGTGVIAVIEVTKLEKIEMSIEAYDVDLSEEDALLIIKINGIDATYLTVISIDDERVPYSEFYLRDGHAFISNDYIRRLANGTHEVSAQFSGFGEGLSAGYVMDRFNLTGNNGDNPTPTPGNDDPAPGDNPTPTPNADDDNPTPTPGIDDDNPTPTPDAGNDDPTPTPGAGGDEPTPTPGIDDGTPTQEPGLDEPTPTPGIDDPQPTADPSLMIPALNAWDAAIETISDGITHTPVSADTLASATYEIDSISCGGNGTYTLVALTKLSALSASSDSVLGDYQGVALGIPAIKISNDSQYIVLALDENGVWDDISSYADIGEGNVHIPSSAIKTGDIAIIKHIHKNGGNGNDTPEPSQSPSPDDGNNDGQATPSPSPSGDDKTTQPTAPPSGDGKTPQPSQAPSSDDKVVSKTDKTSSSKASSSDKDSSDSNSDGSKGSNSSDSSSDASDNSSGTNSQGTSDAKAKSARTGQDGWTMFWTYLMSGLGLD